VRSRWMTVLFCGLIASPLWCAASCLPTGYDPSRFRELKSRGFEVVDDAARQSLALGLLDCLGDTDPELRDGIAFEALSTWMRAGDLHPDTLREIRDRLLPELDIQDAAGFRAPFAALALSEVARVDRVSPYLSIEQRKQLLDAGTAYLRGVRDYRGFVDGEGWRHGVAHGADLLLQLALNPALGTDSAMPILDAVGSQVSPSSVSYHFGEEGRLARVVAVIASRDGLDEAQWSDWLQRISDPAPLDSWNDVFSSERDLARLHNLRAFLLALHVRLCGSNSPAMGKPLHALETALEKIP